MLLFILLSWSETQAFGLDIGGKYRALDTSSVEFHADPGCAKANGDPSALALLPFEKRQTLTIGFVSDSCYILRTQVEGSSSPLYITSPLKFPFSVYNATNGAEGIRAGFKILHVNTVPLQDGLNELYLIYRPYPQQYFYILGFLFEEKEFFAFYPGFMALLSFAYGAIIVPLTFFMILGLGSRNFIYVLYGAFTISFLIYVESYNQFVLSLFGLSDLILHNRFQETTTFIGAFALLFATLYIYGMIGKKVGGKWIDVTALVLSLSCLVQASSSFIDVQFAFHLQNLTIVGAALMGFIIFIFAIKKRLRGSLIMMLGYCWIAWFENHFIAFINGIITPSAFSQLGQVIGGAGEICCFSIAAGIIYLSELKKRVKTEHELAERINNLNGALERHLENVQKTVAEKVQDIKIIMKSIQQGIFTILPQGLKIHEEYSQHLETIFERTVIKDIEACDLLFAHAALGADEKDQARSCLLLAIGEVEISFQLNRHCLPAEMQIELPSGSTKTLELEWIPIVLDGMTEKILVTVRDVTQLRKLYRETEAAKRELRMIGEILAAPYDHFERVMQKSLSLLEENRSLIKGSPQHDPEVLNAIFIRMHTFKGLARSIGARELATTIHDAERYYSDLQHRSDTMWNIEKFQTDFDKVDQVLHEYLALHKRKLGRGSDQTQGHKLERTMLGQFVDNLYSLKPEDISLAGRRLLAPVAKGLTGLYFVTAESAFAEIVSDARDLAREFHKPEPQVQVNIMPCYLTREAYETLNSILVHLVRNSMDHGIETAEARIAKGKNPAGTITVGLEMIDGQARISFKDDGQGLDLELIRKKAIEQSWIDPRRDHAPQELVSFIFEAGFSTREVATEISGRGIGMSAVKDFLSHLGGSIEISLQSAAVADVGSIPFEFVMYLPSSCGKVQHWLNEEIETQERGPRKAAG
ncbi:ATP-binding protein [Oligoflexus tunisiensis]|uniref:ATP-binding protein n=1 Tax=Oligoflexus tunisiensis TaxID=708132 RepID=UPI001C4031B5|nr:ATP-binding protein [Oligoflexus tunisiensis]